MAIIPALVKQFRLNQQAHNIMPRSDKMKVLLMVYHCGFADSHLN